MKKALLFILCAIIVFAFAACGEKEVSNDLSGATGNAGDSGSTYEDYYIEDDEALLSIQDIIGFWNPTEIYQAPRAAGDEFDSDEEALESAQQTPVQISASEFDSPLYYGSPILYKKESVSLDSLTEYGIQIDETLEALAGGDTVIKVDIFEDGSDYPAFQVFLINDSTMLYEGSSGYYFFAAHEESVG